MKALVMTSALLSLFVVPGVVIAQSPRYKATLLSDWAFDADMNNLGQVLITEDGRSTFARSPFLWSPNGTTRPAPAFGKLNDVGDVLYMSNGFKIWNFNTNSGANFATGVPLANPSDGLNHFAIGINNNRFAVGGGTFSSTVNYLWTSPTSAVTTLSYAGGPVTFSTLNNRNEVIGYADNLGRCVIRRANGTLVTPTVAERIVEAGYLNDDSWLVSAYQVGSVWQGYIADDSFQIRHLLPNVVGNGFTGYGRFNKRLETVGTTSDTIGNITTERAILWSPTAGLIDLTSHVDNFSSGEYISEALQITESGSILAVRYELPAGTTSYRKYYYYLEPVPEPASIVGMGLGLAELCRRKRAQKSKAS